jgi:hypothetical protein
VIVLALIVAAAPSAAKAEGFVSAKQWEELYLGFAAAQPAEYAAAERRRISAALVKGCAALEEDDAVMAYSLGEKAVAFDPSAAALVCVGRAGTRTEQKSAAEAALKKGRSAFPNDPRFLLELGRLALSENDADAAAVALAAVPKNSAQGNEAQALLKRARALQHEEKSAKGTLSAMTRELQRKQDAAAGGEPGHTGASTSYESSVDGEGRRLRANSHFRFRYFNGQRDFGQRADYEGKVQAALEEARQAAQRLLGQARESPIDVILYSKAEFTMHHGAQAAQAIAGFYSESAIRMNDSAEITPHNQATLVHEYVHAVVDEVSGFHDERLPTWINEGLAEWTEWGYSGNDDGPVQVRKGLANAASNGGLPTLQEMSHGMLAQQANPALRYAFSATTVGVMMQTGGPGNFLGMIREVGEGQSFIAVLQKRYGRDLSRLQEDVESELKGR